MSEIDSIQPRLQSKQAEALATKANLPVITDLMQLGSLQLLNNDKLVAKAKEKHIALLASGQLLCADPFAMDVRTIKTMAERAGFASKIFVTTGGAFGTRTLSYLIFQRVLESQNIGLGSAGGVYAIILANIVAIFLMRIVGKNLDA